MLGCFNPPAEVVQAMNGMGANETYRKLLILDSFWWLFGLLTLDDGDGRMWKRNRREENGMKQNERRRTGTGTGTEQRNKANDDNACISEYRICNMYAIHL